MDDVKVEGQVEYIELSDNTVKIPTEETVAVDVDETDEEVNSPAIFPRPTVKRKLFADEDVPTDRESTSEMGFYFIDLAADAKLMTRVEKSRALPKPTTIRGAEGGPSMKSPHASSCASNSPIGWWPQLRK